MTLLRASRSLTPKPGIAITMENMFGTPHRTVHIYKADKSGIAPNPLPGTRVKPENRIFYHQHHAAQKYLSGKHLQAMTQRFMRYLSRDLRANNTITREWKEMPNLYSFWQSYMFNAATEALFGPHILSLNPTLLEDFWDYVSFTPTLLKGLPRWTSPGAYNARDKVLTSIKRWHRFAREHSDITDPKSLTSEWDEYWGSTYLKVRQKFAGAIESMDDDGLAAEDLALMVA